MTPTRRHNCATMVPGFTPGLVCPPSQTPPLCFVVGQQRLLIKREHNGIRLPTSDELTALGLAPLSGIYVGQLLEQPCLAIPMPSDPPQGEGLEVCGMRALWNELGDTLFALAGLAGQVVEWKQTHQFCGRCGKPTEEVKTERAMRCPSCSLFFYPTISPAVIVLVQRGQEVLLARSGRFPLPFFSTLAGFVEIGERLEDTVVREVREEVGIQVTNLRYFGSQPWPFPHSLMIGFMADYESGDIHVDGEEIDEAGWFSPESLPQIPARLSIARQLIDAWLATASNK